MYFFLCGGAFFIFKNCKIKIMQKDFKIIGLSAPASFTCQCDKEDIFWAKDGLSEGAYKKLFDWAKNDDGFWKQDIKGTIEFDSYGVNNSAINGKVISITIK
jgi:hypothetical protein